MSADNWAICPKCKKNRDSNEKLKEVESLYGKVPSEKYLYMLKKAEREVPELKETLREDYECGIDEDGIFCVDYSGFCEECGFEYSYKYTEDTLFEK